MKELTFSIFIASLYALLINMYAMFFAANDSFTLVIICALTGQAGIIGWIKTDKIPFNKYRLGVYLSASLFSVTAILSKIGLLNPDFAGISATVYLLGAIILFILGWIDDVKLFESSQNE